MMRLIKSLIISAVSLWVIDALFEGISFADAKTLVVTALILGVLNAVVTPVLKFLTLPINLMTFGLFSFVLSGLVLFVAFQLTDATVSNILIAIIAAFVLSIVQGGLQTIFNRKK